MTAIIEHVDTKHIEPAPQSQLEVIENMPSQVAEDIGTPPTLVGYLRSEARIPLPGVEGVSIDPSLAEKIQAFMDVPILDNHAQLDIVKANDVETSYRRTDFSALSRVNQRRARYADVEQVASSATEETTAESPFEPSWNKFTKPYDPPAEDLHEFLLSPSDVLHPEDEVRIGETIDMHRVLGDDDAKRPRGVPVREWEAMIPETQFFYAACLDPETGKPGFSRLDSLYSLREQFPLEVEEIGSKPRSHNGWKLDPRLERITSGTWSYAQWGSSGYPERRRWLTFTPAQRQAVTEYYDEVVSKNYDGRHRGPEAQEVVATDEEKPSEGTSMATVVTESADSDQRVEFVVPNAKGRRYHGRHFEAKRSLFGRRDPQSQPEKLRNQHLPSRMLGYLGKLAAGTASAVREHLPTVRRPAHVIAALASVALLTAPTSTNAHKKFDSAPSPRHETSISHPVADKQIPAPQKVAPTPTAHKATPAAPTVIPGTKSNVRPQIHPETAYMAHNKNFWTLARKVLVAEGITHPTEYQILKKDTFIVAHNASVKPTEAPAGNYIVG